MFVGFTIAVFIVVFLVYQAMTMLRGVLSWLFRERKSAAFDEFLSKLQREQPGEDVTPAAIHAWADVQSDALVYRTPLMSLPVWLPAPAKWIWLASGIVTFAIRYSFRVWWPVLLAALVLTLRHLWVCHSAYPLGRHDAADGSPCARPAAHVCPHGRIGGAPRE